MNTPKKNLQKKYDKGKIAKRSRSVRNSEPDGFAADSEVGQLSGGRRSQNDELSFIIAMCRRQKKDN